MEDVAIAAAQTASIAGELGVKLLVFPELSLTGYPYSVRVFKKNVTSRAKAPRLAPTS
jgi:predicted amidohydrolase